MHSIGHARDVHPPQQEALSIHMTNHGTFVYSGTELAAMNYARNYYRWMFRHFSPYVGQRAAEVGAGTGNFSEFLLKALPIRELTALEPAANLFPLLQERLRTEARARVVQGNLEGFAGSSSFESVFIVNVLEHVEDDRALLEAARRVLVSGGTLLLFVPALPGIYGSLDAAFGHHRRYRRAELEAKLRAADFRIELIRYFNLPGVFSWFLAGRILRRRTLRPSQIRLYDRLVVPWASRLEQFWEPPLGQSLIAVGRKSGV